MNKGFADFSTLCQTEGTGFVLQVTVERRIGDVGQVDIGRKYVFIMKDAE